MGRSKSSDAETDLYLAHRDQVPNETDAGLTWYFFKDIYRRVWWAIPLALVSAVALYYELKPFVGNTPSIIITCAVIAWCGVVISLMLYNAAGLYDESILAYPIFILCAAFLFSTRGLFTATVFSILAVFSIYWLQINDLFESAYHASFLRAVIVSLLFAVMALVTWVVRNTWETNLSLLNEAYDLTLQGWSRALEYRDGETAGHSRRVTELSLVVGYAVGLGAEDIINLRRGSYLHDIGKMAIPDQILLKPGSLTDAEWEIMKQHPIRSREFLAEIPFLQGAIPIAYSHHERWDGTGYPNRLKGEEIPLLARIFAVVDNWDALTSDRPYRKAWSDEKVTGYLKENAGKMFDPQILEVCLSVISNRGKGQ